MSLDLLCTLKALQCPGILLPGLCANCVVWVGAFALDFGHVKLLWALESEPWVTMFALPYPLLTHQPLNDTEGLLCARYQDSTGHGMVSKTQQDACILRA